MIHDSNLVFYADLRKHDGSTFMSDDAYGHTCSVTGAIWTPQGRYFDGTDDIISCGDNTSLDITSKISLLAWTKYTAVGASNQHILGRDNGTDKRNYALFVAGINGYLGFAFYVGDVAKTISVSNNYVNTWVFLAGTYDGATQNAYLQGIVAATPKDVTGAIDNDDVSLSIGCRTGLTSDFTGLIGDCFIYNRALTPSEIQNLYIKTKSKYR